MHRTEPALDSPQSLEQLLEAAQAGLDPDALLWARLIARRVRSGRLEALGLTRGELAQLLRRPFASRPLLAPARLLPVILTEAKPISPPACANCSPAIAPSKAVRPGCSPRSWPSPVCARIICGAISASTVATTSSAMFDRHFPTLSRRNVCEVRWKKFLAFELSAQRGREPTAAPGCAECEDHAFCYPEGLPEAAA